MATLGSAPSWIPEDDLLLKNAVEGGATLEALAKGAVRFSRKFTVTELRERWHSLLYDPIVSAEASRRMTAAELSPKKPGSANKNGEVASKRKSKSIRRLYYAMHKRVCRDSHMLELSDINYLADLNIVEESNLNGYMRDVCYDYPSDRAPVFSLKQSARCAEASAKPKNSYHEFPDRHGDRAELQEEIDCSHAPPNSSASYHLSGFPSLHSSPPLLNHSEHNSTAGMSMNVNLEDKVQGVQEAMLPRHNIDHAQCSLTEYDSLHAEKMLLDEHDGDQLGESVAISEKYFMDMSDCLLNFANGDDLVSMDTDGIAANNFGQEAKGESSHVISNSCVSSHPDDKHVDLALIPSDALMMEGTTCLASQGSPNAEKPDAATGQSDPGHSEQLHVSSSEANKPSSATKPNIQSLVETYYEEMICTLNSEDPEIPCNDDFPSPAALSCSAIQQSNNGSTRLAFPSSSKKVEEESVLRKEEKKAESASMVYQIPETLMQTDAGPNCHRGNTGIEASDGQCAGNLLKEARDVKADMDPSAEKSSATDFLAEAAEDSSVCDNPELDGSPSGLDYDDNESDPHIPSFADIEAMILDMDLWPKNCESYAGKEVARYKNEDARRAIIRMEQCARSSIQRAIGSRGALAVLYGRHSKHYIKKDEVILGRSTDDFDVDIDLVREGGTNRISRRQALIKLEKEGSFFLKNLGKNSVFLNGKEVYNGECIRLTPSCLIEVKGIAFIFEMNDKCVSQYLGKLARESQREKTSFEWSPEGVP